MVPRVSPRSPMAVDPRVLALAARVAEGSERDVPGLLLKLKGNLFRSHG